VSPRSVRRAQPRCTTAARPGRTGLRQQHSHVLIRPLVQLGRSSRTGAGAAGAALVNRVEQILVHKPVEMKRRGGARQLKSRSGLIATDRFGLAHHARRPCAKRDSPAGCCSSATGPNDPTNGPRCRRATSRAQTTRPSSTSTRRYAAGDVANTINPRYHARIRVEHWANALHGGPTAARSMLGQPVSSDVTVWGRWFETATYMIDGVFDRLLVAVAVHGGLGGGLLPLDFDEVQGIGYIEYPTGAVRIQDQDQVGACTLLRIGCARLRCRSPIPPMSSSYAS
jgi:hypothetical protein